MKPSSTALAALLAAAISSTAIVPAALAQDGAKVTIEQTHFRPEGRMMMRMERGPGAFLDLVCAPDGAEALEIALVRLDHRLELTDTQRPLFDTFKTSALTAQTSFADKCDAAAPAKDAATAPDLVDRLKARIAIDTARLEALNTVLPDFEALFDSLTDAQKSKLVPDRDDRRGFFREFRDHAPGRYFRAPAPGRG
jgi:hypothetical protein